MKSSTARSNPTLLPSIEFNWEPVESLRPRRVYENEIWVAYDKTDHPSEARKAPHLTFRFGEAILDHLDAIPGERLMVMHDKSSPYNYLLVKAADGYKIQADSISKVYRIQFRYKRDELKMFKGLLVPHFLHANKTVRIELPHN